MASSRNYPKYEDVVERLYKVAGNITQLFGNLSTHMQNLENLENNIDEESQACVRPSVASKFNDFRSLVHDVLRKVRSYKSCCQDLAEFGKHYEEENVHALNEILVFVQELNSYSSQLNTRMDAIIAEIGRAIDTAREQNSSMSLTQVQVHDEGSSAIYDCFTRLFLAITGSNRRDERPDPREHSLWKEGEEKLENLSSEAKHLKEVVRIFSENTAKCLATWPDESEYGEHLHGGIGKIIASCTQLQLILNPD